MAFVACVPPADSAGLIRCQPASVHYSNHLDPRALCSGRVIMSRPSSLVRPDPPVSTTPPDFPRTLVIQEALPDDLVWAVADTFPALGQHSFHTCRHLYAGGRSRSISPMSPCSHGLPQFLNESAPPSSRHRLQSGLRVDASTSVRLMLRRACLLALLDRSDLETALRPPRTFTRAFPQKGRPPRESGIATRHPGRIP